MAYALIGQFAEGSTDGNAFTTTTPFNTAGADLIVIILSKYQSPSANNPTDNKGNSYTPLTFRHNANSDATVRIFYKQAPSVGSGHTFTTDNNSFVSMHVLAFSGSVA